MENIKKSESVNPIPEISISQIAHEIRNPLALISSELQMLESKYSNLVSDPLWNSLMENTEYLQELLTDLSDYHNAPHLTLTPTDLHAFIQSITDSFSSSMNYLGIIFETETKPDLPLVNIDRIKFRQALINLLKNAQEASVPSKGYIKLSASKVPDGILLTVQDNGNGMTESQLNTVFQPFVTYKSGGTGLGLAITRQIITAHGGRISVQSASMQGSCFNIFLPLCPNN